MYLSAILERHQAFSGTGCNPETSTNILTSQFNWISSHTPCIVLCSTIHSDKDTNTIELNKFWNEQSQPHPSSFKQQLWDEFMFTSKRVQSVLQCSAKLHLPQLFNDFPFVQNHTQPNRRIYLPLSCHSSPMKRRWRLFDTPQLLR